MTDIEFLKEVENKYSVNSIKINNMEIWPFLRIKYAEYILFEKEMKKNISFLKNFNLKSFLNFIIINILSFKIFLKKNKYKYIIFSSIDSFKKFNNIYIDIYNDEIIKNLGINNYIYVTSTFNFSMLRSLNKIEYPNYFSFEFILILSKIINLIFKFKKLKIQNEEILIKINEEYKVDINYKSIIKIFLSNLKIYEVFFNIFKPSLIFIIDSYSLSHMSAIFMANLLNIKTIEIQHGLINESHRAYNLFTYLNESFYPKYLLVFGDHFKNYFNNSFFIKKENVFTVGHRYIDYIRNEYKISKDTEDLFRNLRKKYNKIIAVSGQEIYEKELLDFIIESANLDNSICFIYVPRNYYKNEKLYLSYAQNNQIIFFPELNIYEIIIQSDFHSTLWSTTALESIALGVPNIFINIKRMSEIFYSKTLINSQINQYANDPISYVEILTKFSKLTRNEIIDLSYIFYEKNYKFKVKEFLNLINKDLKC